MNSKEEISFIRKPTSRISKEECAKSSRRFVGKLQKLTNDLFATIRKTVVVVVNTTDRVLPTKLQRFSNQKTNFESASQNFHQFNLINAFKLIP